MVTWKTLIKHETKLSQRQLVNKVIIEIRLLMRVQNKSVQYQVEK